MLIAFQGNKGSQTVNSFKRLTAERAPPSKESGEADIKRKFQWYEEAKQVMSFGIFFRSRLQLAAKVSADAGLKSHPAIVKFLEVWNFMHLSINRSLDRIGSQSKTRT